MNTQSLTQVLDRMWEDYIGLNPLAKKVKELFTLEGERVVNDHIALRTFQCERVGVDKIAAPFLNMGYRYKMDYQFPDKKLYAKHFEHPDNHFPKIFISELKISEFSDDLQKIINELVLAIPKGAETKIDFTYSGRPWEISFETYEKLLKESDYAAWLAAIGYRPNHFTVSINHLKKFTDIKDLNDFLKSKDIKLNSSGGEIKGSPEVLLEQSSTLANSVEINFADGKHFVPGCYYEFAKRYNTPEGRLYQGFVATSADKIFESTNSGQ